MKDILKKYDILFVILVFLLCIPAEYYEIFSLLEDQTVFFRHGIRSGFIDRKEMSFPYDKIVLVTIDETFYGEYRKSPLKRRDLAKIINNLNRLGAKVVCVDLLMDLASAYDEDTILAKALEQGETVLASQALFDTSNQFQRLNYPTPLLKNSGSSGYVNLTSSSSVVTFLSRLRIFPEITEWEDGWPIAIQTVSKYLEVKPVLQNRELTLGNISVPLDQFNDIYIDFSIIPEGYRFLHQLAGISAAEFLDISGLDKHEARELKDWIKGKIVILGETSAVSPDWFDTPVGMIYGAEIIADTVNTLLKGAPLRPARLWGEILASFIFLSSIVLCIYHIRTPWPQILLSGIFMPAAFVIICTVLYVWHGFALSMTYNLTGGLSAFFVLSISSYLRERKLKIAERREKEQAEREREAAKAASKAKGEFLANMSHEFRTPLNAILGFSQMIKRSGTLPLEHRKNLDIIHRSGEHLLNLVNSVLDLSKIEAGRLTLSEQNIDLYGLLSEMEDMLRLRAEDKGLCLVFDQAPDVPQYVRLDETKLRQVLINLLSNAIKFTNEGSVLLRVSHQKSDTRLFFEVEDTGPGIARNELESLFEAFLQTKTGQESREGTGLGLSISQKFVKLMGGEMTVSSEENSGSVFKFDIKFSNAAAASIEIRQSAPRVIGLEPGQPRYRILIADDKSDNRKTLASLLVSVGFEIQEAYNGREAVEIWKVWKPDLIWMDVKMPVMNGYEATRQIRKLETGNWKQKTESRKQKSDNPEFPISGFQFRTPIIAITASAPEENRPAVLTAGCDDFLSKPFKESELLYIMKKHLGVRYVYDVPLAEKSRLSIFNREPGLMISSLAALPSDLLTNLEHATLRADIKLILTLIGEIRRSDSVLADVLTSLADDYEYSEILTVIKQAKEQN